MMGLPVSRAKELLYKNGLVDPRLCEWEIHFYHCHARGIWLGYIKDGEVITETASNMEECHRRTRELKEGGTVTDVVVVDKALA